MLGRAHRKIKKIKEEDTLDSQGFEIGDEIDQDKSKRDKV